ncbi:MAG: histidine phosphatase family protein [Roseinatronobacter sp.]
MHRVLGYVILFTLALASGLRASDGPSPEMLLDALRSGGHVVFVRHADTTGQPRDATMDLTDRANQRNLSVAGRAQAVAMGEGIVCLGLAAGRVASSPVYRARDTAELAFGVARVEIDPGLTADDYVASSYAPFVAAHRALLATVPAVGNTWLFGHWIPLAMAVPGPISAHTFPEGAAAVFRPQGDDFVLRGILLPPWWQGCLEGTPTE